MLYPYVNRMLLAMYNCINLNDTFYLMADLDVICFSPEWWNQAVLIFPFALFYSLGIPLIYGRYLYKNRARFRDPYFQVKAGFLYESFSDPCWYFELVDMLHKLIQVSMIPFLPTHLELPASMIGIVIYLLLILELSPYVRRGDDRLQLFALMYLYCLASAGYTLFEWELVHLPPEIDLLVSMLLITIVISMASIAVAMCFASLKQLVIMYVRNRQIKRAEEEEIAERERRSNQPDKLSGFESFSDFVAKMEAEDHEVAERARGVQSPSLAPNEQQNPVRLNLRVT